MVLVALTCPNHHHHPPNGGEEGKIRTIITTTTTTTVTFKIWMQFYRIFFQCKYKKKRGKKIKEIQSSSIIISMSSSSSYLFDLNVLEIHRHTQTHIYVLRTKKSFKNIQDHKSGSSSSSRIFNIKKHNNNSNNNT